MPAVRTADQATDLALAFLRRSGWTFVRALSAHQKDGTWVVEVDVGALSVRKGNLKVDSRTGAIVEYDVPQLVR